MRTSKRRILSMVLALMLCFSVLPVTAFAGGGPEDGSDKVLEYWSQDSTPPQDNQQTDQQTPPAETTTPAAGEPLSVGSEFFTRDLLYNKDTHKQFITVEGRDGNIFYIVIDYDAPVNEDEEQYQTYFLNKVDEADLSALVEQGEPAACICTDKCHAGAVNTVCPVCSVNMTECAGKEPEPEKQEEPAETDTEPDPEPEKKGGVNGMLIVVLAAALAGGGAVYFLKFKKKKPDTRGSAAQGPPLPRLQTLRRELRPALLPGRGGHTAHPGPGPRPVPINNLLRLWDNCGIIKTQKELSLCRELSQSVI